MKIEKFKVLLYLKKSGTDKSGKAPIMGRITVNRTMTGQATACGQCGVRHISGARAGL